MAAKAREILAENKQATENVDVERFNPLNAELNPIFHLLA